jgi:hypothetical protein
VPRGHPPAGAAPVTRERLLEQLARRGQRQDLVLAVLDDGGARVAHQLLDEHAAHEPHAAVQLGRRRCHVERRLRAVDLRRNGVVDRRQPELEPQRRLARQRAPRLDSREHVEQLRCTSWWAIGTPPWTRSSQ